MGRRKNRYGMESLQVVIIIATAALVLIVVKHAWPTIEESIASRLPGAIFIAESEGTLSAPPLENVLKHETLSDNSKPTLFQNALVIGALLAVIGWSSKEIVFYIGRRVDLALLFVLSDQVPRSHARLIAEAQQHPAFAKVKWFAGSGMDSLARLVSQDKIFIRHGLYVCNHTDTTINVGAIESRELKEMNEKALDPDAEMPSPVQSKDSTSRKD